MLTTGAAMRLAFSCAIVGALWLAVAWALCRDTRRNRPARPDGVLPRPPGSAPSQPAVPPRCTDGRHLLPGVAGVSDFVIGRFDEAPEQFAE